MGYNEKIELFLELTTTCNYRCIFCNNKNVEKRTILLSDIKGLDDMVNISSYVDITGYGEILTHPEFEQIINHFSLKNVPIRIVTNGSLLNEKNRNIIANSSISELVISINSLNKETYKKLTGVGDLEVVLENIDQLVKIYKKSLYFSFVINAYNFNEIPNFIDLGVKYKITEVSCLGLTPMLEYNKDLILEANEENRNKLIEYRKYAKEKNMRLYAFNFDTQVGTKERDENLSEKIKKCKWVYTKFFIEGDGQVGPCCWAQVRMGNIKEQSFDEIWNGEKYNELRECIKNGDLKYCSKCRMLG